MNLAIKKLNDWAKKKGHNQNDIATLIGKTQSYVSMVRSGKVVVPDGVKTKISEVTNNFVKVTDWFKESE